MSRQGNGKDNSAQISAGGEMDKLMRESEKQMRLVADAIPALISYVDAEHRYQFVNKTYTDWFGHKPEEIAGKHVREVLGEAAYAAILPAMERVLSGEAFSFERLMPYKDGGSRFVLINYVPDKDESGKVKGYYALITDITERKNAEEIGARYRMLSVRARDVILFVRPDDGQIVDANQKAVETYGYDLPTLLQMKIHDLRSPETLPLLAAQIKQADEGGVQFETVHRRRDGSEFPVEVSTIGSNIGGERLLTSIIRDITERKHAEEALIKAERRAAEDYQALLSRIVPLAQTLGTTRDLISIYRVVREFIRNSMPCSAFFVSFYDVNNNLRTAAYAWGDKGEVDISALPPMTLTEDGGPNSQAVFQKKSVIVNLYMKFMENRPHVILQKDGIDPQTSLVVPMIVMNRVVGTLEVQAYENNAFNQEHIVALEMAANLAAVAVENVRLLQIEAKAREAAEAANRAKDEFLSVLSHELRTPLNAMLGWVRMLRTGMLDEERSNQALEVIERNTRLQNSLIEDLLDVSRIISGKMRIDKEEVDLVAVAGNSCEVLHPSAESKNILFEFSSEDKSLLIEGDAVRLQQIISNLVQNAIKFTPEGGKISVTLKNIGDKAHLVVKDTGIGIEEEFLPYIFERFRQADASTRRNYTGLGLGLTIVSNLVELHGGRAHAISDGKGQGSTFTVELPLAGKYLNENDETGSETLLEENNFNLKGARILLVDDDAESIIPLQMLLEKEKAEVVTVFSADEALAKLMEQTFHILVSDIGMPSMDGYDLIAGIRKLTTEQNAFLPAIALTAYAANEDRRRALSAGFQMHFSKPFDFDELLAAIIKLYKDSK